MNLRPSASVLAVLAFVLATPRASAAERLLLCRAVVRGDASLARPDAVPAAARSLSGRFLDYGVPCEGAEEAARAARRAGLAFAVSTTAEGRTTGSRYVLTLADANAEQPRARRELEVAPGADAVALMEKSLTALLEALPPDAARSPSQGPLILGGAGVAAIAAGTVLAIAASDAAGRATAATSPQAYVDLSDASRARRAWSAVALGVGGAAVVAAAVWKLAF